MYSLATQISVALASCNGEEFILQQLESIASQNYSPKELVITDDCSDDATLDIIKGFARDAPFPVRVSQNKRRLGYKANFMKCAGLCSGELIAFCDQDDVWSGDKLSTMRDHLNSTGALLAYHNSDVVDRGLNFIRPYWKHGGEALMDAEKYPWAGCLGFAQMFRRELLGFEDLWRTTIHAGKGDNLPHDEWMFFLASSLQLATYIAKPLVKYRQHDTNTVGFRDGQGLIRRLRRRVSSPKSWDVSASVAARNRVGILRELQSRIEISAHQGVRLAFLGELYADIASRSDRRSEMMNVKERRSRLILFARNVARGGYAISDARRFGVFGAVRDLLEVVTRGSIISVIGR